MDQHTHERQALLGGLLHAREEPVCLIEQDESSQDLSCRALSARHRSAPHLLPGAPSG